MSFLAVLISCLVLSVCAAAATACPPQPRFAAGHWSPGGGDCFQSLGGPGRGGFDFASYMERLDQRILRMRRQSAYKFDKTAGFAKVAFTYKKDGHIDTVFLYQTSGDQKLNAAAKSLIGRLPKMEPLPEQGPEAVRCYYSVYGQTSGAGEEGVLAEGDGHISGRVIIPEELP